MTHPPPEPDLAALREEIRRAGACAAWVRKGLCVSLLALVAWSARCLVPRAVDDWYVRAAREYFRQTGYYPYCGTPYVHAMDSAVAQTWVFGLPAAFALALLGTALYRRTRTCQFRRVLAPLPPEARGRVLQPLETDRCRHTRSIVAPLVREFGHQTELTPAAPPTGRGDEVTPTS